MSATPCTVGLALDVSGSMQGSILNSRHEEFSRLEGLQNAIDSLLQEVERLTSASKPLDTGRPLRVFAYAFGLNKGPTTGDLFRLLQIFDALKNGNDPEGIIDCEVNKMRVEIERRLKYDEREVAISIMGSRAYRLLSMSRKEAESVLRREIEDYIRQNVLDRVLESARSDLTLSFEELAERWGRIRGGIAASNSFLGDGTPMCQCLSLIRDRFVRERASGPPGSKYVLFTVSDGQSTDGDPRSEARAIEDLGIQIVSCFVTSTDETAPKCLYEHPSSRWSEGAKAMFDIASRVPEDSPEVNYLRNAGWEIDRLHPLLRLRKFLWHRVNRGSKSASGKGVKLFAQINHTQHLDDFIKVILTPIKLEHPIPVSRTY